MLPQLTLHLRSRLFLFCLLALGMSLSAQRGPLETKPLGKVKGTLIDKTTDEPIGFANVVIYTITDSLVTGTTTDIDGSFEIDGVPLGEYRVEMSFLGYDTENREVEINELDQFFVIGDVTLGTGGQDLDEIVVTAERAVMELGLDRKVFNVEKSVAAAGGSAEDLLRQLPSISVDLEGNVSLRGSGNVRFLINGRPSGLVGTDPATYLKSLSATNIERIEVITNPGAAFDPDGTAGLINIVLKNKQDDGFNASINLNAGTNNKFDGSLDMNWRKGKFNTFGGISGRYDERFFRGFRDQEGIISDSSFTRRFTFDGDRLRKSTTVKLGTEYALTKRSILGIQGNYQLENGNSNNNRVTSFFNSGGELERLSNRLETEPSEESNYEIQATYSTTFKKEGRKLSANLQFSENDEDELENYDENIFDGSDNFLEEVRQRSPALENRTQWIGQLDYEQMIGDFKFETGWRSTIQELTTDSEFAEFDGQNFIRNNNQSNLFSYEEDIHALYASFGGTIEDLTFSAGLRAEQAYTTSNLLAPDVETFENDYFKVYPSIFLGYAFDDNTSLQVSYSRRINRPRAWALNPFVDRGDPFNLRSGNPFLLPELINSFELNVQQRYGLGTLTAGLYFRQLNDLISRISIAQPGGVTLSTRGNLDQGRNYGIELINTLRFGKKFEVTASANGYRSEIIGLTNDNQAVDANGYLFSGNIQGGYELPGDVQAQFTYFYRSPGVRPQGRIKAIQSFDLGFRKEILDKKGAITLRVTDLFNTRRYRFETELPSLTTNSEFQRESRIVYVGFQYSLQQLKPQRDRGGRGGRGGGGDDGGDFK